MNYIERLFILVSFTLLLFSVGCKSQDISPKTVESESWTKHWGSDKNDIGEDIVVTNTGIYITGVTLGELDNNVSAGEWDIFLTKYNFKGDQEWTVQWGTEGRDKGNGIGADSTGIYITGYVNGSLDNSIYNGGDDLFLIKFDFSGIKLWTVQMGTPEDDYGNKLEVSHSGVYVTGFTKGNFDNNKSSGKDDIFLTKFNTEGIVLWTRQWGTENVDWGNDISVHNTDVYVTGFTKGDLPDNKNSGFNDIFLTKYNSEGIHQWTRQWGTENNDEGRSIVSDSTGIYITGRTNGNLDGNRRIGLDDIFLTKYDLTGQKQWTELFGTKIFDYGFALAKTDKTIFITGSSNGEFKGNKNLGYYDIYLASYNLSGEKQWIKQLGTGGFDYGRSISLKGSDIYISGGTSHGPDDSRNSGDNRDVFLKKIRLAGFINY